MKKNKLGLSCTKLRVAFEKNVQKLWKQNTQTQKYKWWTFLSWNKSIFNPLMQINIQWSLLDHGNRGGFIFMFLKFLPYPRYTIFSSLPCQPGLAFSLYYLDIIFFESNILISNKEAVKDHVSLKHWKSKLPCRPRLACQSRLHT